MIFIQSTILRCRHFVICKYLVIFHLLVKACVVNFQCVLLWYKAKASV